MCCFLPLRLNSAASSKMHPCAARCFAGRENARGSEEMVEPPRRLGLSSMDRGQPIHICSARNPAQQFSDAKRGSLRCLFFDNLFAPRRSAHLRRIHSALLFPRLRHRLPSTLLLVGPRHPEGRSIDLSSPFVTALRTCGLPKGCHIAFHECRLSGDRNGDQYRGGSFVRAVDTGAGFRRLKSIEMLAAAFTSGMVETAERQDRRQVRRTGDAVIFQVGQAAYTHYFRPTYTPTVLLLVRHAKAHTRSVYNPAGQTYAQNALASSPYVGR